MSTAKIEELQQIVDDVSLPAEQRKAAAEKILALGAPESQHAIADDDPELLAFMEKENAERTAILKEYQEYCAWQTRTYGRKNPTFSEWLKVREALKLLDEGK